MIVFRDQNYRGNMANTVCFTTGRKVHPVFTTQDDTTASVPPLLSSFLKSSLSVRYLYRAALSRILVNCRATFFFFFSLFLNIYVYISGKLGCCAVDTALKSLYTCYVADTQSGQKRGKRNAKRK